MKVFFALSLLAVLAEGKVYDRCELAQELVNTHGFDQGTVADWICLTYYESGWNTAATNENTNGSRDYGLFEINSNYWCTVGGSGNGCNINCNRLIDINIADDCACAKTIHDIHGFGGWVAWTNNCQGTDISSWIEGCFDLP